MTPPLFGIGLALVAAAGNNLGKGLQKAATRQLPALSLAKPEVVLAYLSSPTWLIGMLLDVGGGGAMLGALAAAPVSLVQPVAAFGLVLLAAFSHLVLQERLGPSQWRGAAVATLGIVGMGISSSSSSSSSSADAIPAAAAATPAPAPQTGAGAVAEAAAAATIADPQPSLWRVLGCFLLLLSLLGFEVLWRQQRQAAAAAKRRRAGTAVAAGPVDVAAATADATACGLEAGCCFGFSAAAARTGFQLSQSGSWLLVPLGLAASVGLTSSGFVLQTRGFKHGSALVVCTTAAAASIVAGVLVGLLALAEPLPPTLQLRLLLLASWAAIFAGVSNMASSEHMILLTSHDHDKATAATSSRSVEFFSAARDRAANVMQELLLLLPRGVRHRVLPQWVRHWLGRNAGGGLVGVWRAALGGSMKGHGEVRAGLMRSVSVDDGPGLPVSRCDPEGAAVLAPQAGGVRR